MHYTHFYPRIGYFGMWADPYFLIPGLIGLAALTVMIVLIVRASKKRKTISAEGSSEALDLLKLKFVKGEIDEETYKKKLLLLK